MRYKFRISLDTMSHLDKINSMCLRCVTFLTSDFSVIFQTPVCICQSLYLLETRCCLQLDSGHLGYYLSRPWWDSKEGEHGEGFGIARACVCGSRLNGRRSGRPVVCGQGSAGLSQIGHRGSDRHVEVKLISLSRMFNVKPFCEASCVFCDLVEVQ